MGVHADQLEVGRVAEAAHRLLRAAVGEPEAELAVLLAGLHEVVRGGPHAGRDAHEDLLALPARGGGGLEAFDLLERVDDEVPDADVESELDLGD